MLSKYTLRMFLILALASSSLSVVACGGDDGGDSGEDEGRAGRSGRAGRGGSGGKAGAGGEAGSGKDKDAGPSCEGEDGCYDCEPKETEQYLNRCTDSECEPFDNEERLPLYNGGDLPKLP